MGADDEGADARAGPRAAGVDLRRRDRARADDSADDPIVVVDLEVPRPLVDAVVSAARRRRAPVVFDPSPPGEVDDRLLEGVDVITPDHVEAAALTGVATTSARCRGRRQERRR